MHERTRRRMCRWGFLVFCLAPTLCVAAWVGVSQAPFYRTACKAAWERSLSQQVGLTVTPDAVHEPRPGTVVVEGMQLADPETNRRLATVRQIELRPAADELLVRAVRPEIERDQLGRLGEALHDRLLRNRAAGPLPARLQIAELRLRDADGRGFSSLADVECRLQPAESGPEAIVSFRDAALRNAEPVQLRITRNRQIAPPATRWVLQTRAAPLPCSLLADQVPLLRGLGTAATFQGDADVTWTPDGWRGNLTGRFRGVDLDRLVSDHFAHTLGGTADVLLRQASFADGRLQHAAGELMSEGGVISWSLLEQAERSLGLAADARVYQERTTALCPYRQLRLSFDVRSTGLKIASLAQAVDQGVILLDDRGPLLSAQPGDVRQVAALAWTLASRPGENAPPSFEAARLLHLLPLPAASSPRVSSGQSLRSPQ